MPHYISIYSRRQISLSITHSSSQRQRYTMRINRRACIDTDNRIHTYTHTHAHKRKNSLHFGYCEYLLIHLYLQQTLCLPYHTYCLWNGSRDKSILNLVPMPHKIFHNLCHSVDIFRSFHFRLLFSTVYNAEISIFLIK